MARLGIRRLLKARLAELHTADAAASADLTQAFLDDLPCAPTIPEGVRRHG